MPQLLQYIWRNLPLRISKSNRCKNKNKLKEWNKNKDTNSVRDKYKNWKNSPKLLQKRLHKNTIMSSLSQIDKLLLNQFEQI